MCLYTGDLQLYSKVDCVSHTDILVIKFHFPYIFSGPYVLYSIFAFLSSWV